ncbi:hypothetical protein EMPS_01768 [Entomortierella parvispora]|uniref:Protein kinase domain-containing protein n=1 Tax=Entomortierella parvispora TaxID=205924 RepID=A0A9P3H469_9FUNG|nr:hypothetical protein EMPS_01768 [Entomortierella parvispora]
MASLTLNCITIDRLEVCSVIILSTSTVSLLRKAINIQMGFATPAENLTLWQVNILSTESTPEKYDALSSLHEDNKLNLSLPLLTLFPLGAPEGVFHIAIRWQRLLSEYAFFRVPPPDIIVANQESPGTLPDSIRKFPLTPRKVHSWDTFVPSVLGMSLATTPMYARPVFYRRRVAWSKLELCWIFNNDIGSVEGLPPFPRISYANGLLCGVPDGVCLCTGIDGPYTELFPLAFKMPDAFRLPDGVSFHEAYHQQGSISHGPAGPLNQIYGYMKLNGHRYGMLSTYNQTWFLKITGEVDDELLVSTTIPYDSTEPTVRQCYWWLVRAALTDGKMDISHIRTARLVRTKEQTNRGFKRLRREVRCFWPPRYGIGQDATTRQRIGRMQWRWREDVEYEYINIPVFRNMKLFSIGEEGVRTHRATWKGMDVMVKRADVWNEPTGVQELETEEKAYHLLKRLQGRYIPRMQMTGTLNGMEMILVTEYMGNRLENDRLDASDRDKIRKALSAIHDKGILHGDIQPIRIVVNRDGEDSRFFFIDLGLSEFTRNRKVLEREAKELEEMLDHMPWPETMNH